MRRGTEFHGEVASADASGAGVAFVLYPAGLQTAHTLAANQYVHITDIAILSAAALAVGVYSITDAAGKRAAKIYAPVNGGAIIPLQTPHVCPRGITPYLVASGAGNVLAIIHGFITSG